MESKKLVTQAELQELQKLEQIVDVVEQKRQEIRQRVLDGHPVEPGPLEVRIEERKMNELNQKNLCEVVGSNFAKLILDNLPKFKRFAMVLKKNNRGRVAENSEPQPVFDPAKYNKTVKPGRKIDPSEFLQILETKMLCARPSFDYLESIPLGNGMAPVVDIDNFEE